MIELNKYNIVQTETIFYISTNISSGGIWIRYTSHAMQKKLVGAGIYTWENATSLLPMIALIVWTIASWQDNPKWMRVAEFMICIMCIIYDLFVRAYTGCLTEFIILTSAAIGMFRHDMKKKEEGE